MIHDCCADVNTVVNWLCFDQDITPGQILRDRSKKPAVVELRDTAVYVLHAAGGFTYAELAECFAAYGSKQAAQAAARRAVVEDTVIADARKLLWSRT